MAQIKNTGRLIGAVVPVGALRGDQSIGVGEFPDLVEFGTLCKKMGIKLIQLLPVNDTGYQDSPYFALTAFALHPLYLRISELPEFAASENKSQFEAKLKALREEFEPKERFPCLDILRKKIALLRELYAECAKTIVKKAKGKSPLADWIKANPWVRSYSVFRKLKEDNEERSWKEWPEFQKVTTAQIEAFWNDPKLEEAHLFWVWIQEALDRQFSQAAKSLNEMGITLEGDLPILINEDSCDVWSQPEIFNLDLSAGAPPDMYAPDGQNWGFPTFNWKVQEQDDYAWWKARLKSAEKYYSAYRIDHVLGFFRIWSSRRDDSSNNSVLGRYIPYVPVTTKDLEELKFDKGRIRWMSQPHIFTGEVFDAIKSGWKDGNDWEINAAAEETFKLALERIGQEELWLFKSSIKGSKEIEALDIHPAAKAYLVKAWGNRLLFEYEPGSYVPVWFYRDNRAYPTLSKEEQDELVALFKDKQIKTEKIWEKEGRKLLTILASSSSMLPCAEDLGAVPACVPKVLKELHILGLRVVRWYREWDKEGQPYVPFEDYPELSACTPAVHDSSTLREWWDREADQELFAGFLGFPSLPKVYNPGTANHILFKIAAAASRFRVFQFQDLLHLSNKWYAADPADERINVPGTQNDFNWTWRLPAVPAQIG
ncbi:MAG: 4-alpha-glucanotransferase, partial [Treponema sp.]|nr:4-alpha-glucanotransferase [Treponema sp.]